MPSIKRKNKSLTVEQRIAQANESVGTALFVFEQAAVTLEQARDEQFQIADDLAAEAAALQAKAIDLLVLSGQVEEAGLKADQQADNLRSLLNVA